MRRHLADRGRRELAGSPNPPKGNFQRGGPGGVHQPCCSSTSWRSHSWGSDSRKWEFQNIFNVYCMSGCHRGSNPSSCPSRQPLQRLLFLLVFLTWSSRLSWAGPELPGPSHLTACPEPTMNSHTFRPLPPWNALSADIFFIHRAASSSSRLNQKGSSHL